LVPFLSGRPCYGSTRVASSTTTSSTTIVYLHGMAGGHLAQRDGRRVWLSAAGLVRGSVGEELSGALNPAGHIKLFHRPAALFWRRRGFGVQEFAYDWRLGLDEAASALRSTIASQAPSQRLIIAAHSMGGCVACRFSALFPDEAARVERAFFFGVPVSGTFSAVEVVLGSFALPRLVAAASWFRSRKRVLEEITSSCSQMEGLIELLPDPEVFPSAAILYDRRNWPAECAPPQSLLDRARALKAELPRSPILARTTVLAASNWSTPAGVAMGSGGLRLDGKRAPGDGVTLFASAAPLPGMKVHRMRYPHALLLFEASGLREVAAA
jgi:pimeloyl-ACP methyl ester carboxylesterase